ncbi:class I SAM-dependent methyltransferase [Pedococcus sp. NPDC057267]|uniref:class I SAM-dependent methyltransferase n=1 Tax=Pedococcus sp. NPDC057267 TaxID=3346077 RepID=UPI0036446714
MDLKQTLTRAATTPAVVRLRHLTFKGSGRYWEDRYAAGGTSGPGSYGASAQWKAEVVNSWVRELGVTSVIDLGCGDGNQLSLADYPRYLGVDRSATAIRQCIERFKSDPTKSFLRFEPTELADPAGWLRADMALSMEVIFHLVEDEVFEDYMRRLFASAERYVVICSNDAPGSERVPHERHRSFTAWIARECPQWQLQRKVDPPAETGLMSSLYLYASA